MASMRRTSSTCKNILDDAIGLGLIVRWRDFYQRSYDYERPCWVEVDYPNFASKAFNGHNFEEAFGFAADHVLNLYPKETAVKTVDECRQIIKQALDDGILYGAYYPDPKMFTDPKMAGGFLEVWPTAGREGHVWPNDNRKVFAPSLAEKCDGITNYNRVAEFVLSLYPKENDMTALHPDSSSYADCFRILREAKKDGVISHFAFYSNISDPASIAVYERTNAPRKHFEDKDGTKGYIGLLREAAAYCLDLRKKRQPKPTGKMSEEQLANEIMASGYTLRMDTVANTSVPTLALYKNGSHSISPCGLSMQSDEVRCAFLARCVEWIREQK